LVPEGRAVPGRLQGRFRSPHKREFRDARFGGAEAPAAEYLFVALERADAAARERIRCALVSTDSITHGEQVGVLWPSCSPATPR